MRCPKCGTEMETARTLQSLAMTVRMRICPKAECGASFATEELPAGPGVYHRLRREEASRQRAISAAKRQKPK